MQRMKLLAGAAALMALVVVSACGKSSSPTSPSSPSFAKAGAVINGTVSGVATGSSLGYGKLDTSSGVTVTIAGTELKVTVDASGKFVLTGVPAGTVELVITANGVPTTITLEGVKETDKIVIKITIKGTTATLEDEERNGLEMTELEDQIASIDATNKSLVVGGIKVDATSAVIRQGNNDKVDFATLKVGNRVHVRGTMPSPGQFTATEVKLQNTNAKVPVNVSGKLSDLLGQCNAITFTVEGWKVYTEDKTTDFGKAGCTAVTATSTVHVKGDVQGDGRVLASSVQVK